MSAQQPTQENKEDLKCKIREKLAKEVLPAPFPPCTDIILCQVKEDKQDEITTFYDEYFSKPSGMISLVRPKEISGEKEKGDKEEWDNLSKQWYQIPVFFPWCLPPSLTVLNGKRGTECAKKQTLPLKRLFIGDLVWLFYFERMGIFKILGVILDDYATKGKHPISPAGSTTGILETMVRLTKMGLSSTVRDRDSSYRRCLGWSSDVGRKLGSDAVVNTAFNSLFHKFIQNALEFYKDKRLAEAIRGKTGEPAKPSVATLISIGDTIDVLKKAFTPFNYGRSYLNTLSGIVWCIAAMDLIKRMRTTLGIPDTLKEPHEYLPAAYDILVMGKPITPSEINRYKVHLECARNARDILLDLEVLDYNNKGELETWLDIVEDKIEGLRTAYRSLTGVELGAPGTPKIEQQV